MQASKSNDKKMQVAYTYKRSQHDHLNLGGVGRLAGWPGASKVELKYRLQ